MLADHHWVVETSKGVPTNRAGTPDAPHLELPTAFAKGFFAKITAKMPQAKGQLNSVDGSTLTPGPIVEEIATRLI
jgi:hypothetical protein